MRILLDFAYLYYFMHPTKEYAISPCMTTYSEVLDVSIIMTFY